MGLTVKKSSDGGFDEGWQIVIISEAEYGDYNGSSILIYALKAIQSLLNAEYGKLETKKVKSLAYLI